MADQQNPEEFQRVMNEFIRNIQDGLPIQKEELERLKRTAEINQKINAGLGQTSKSLKELGQSAYDGKLGVTQFNQGIDAMAGALGAAVAALGFLLPATKAIQAGLALLGLGIAGASKAFKMVNEQSEALFKTYQDLSKTGQAAAGGMTEVFNNMQKFGYGIKELDQMTALLKENSVALAAFGGTAAAGSKAFADAASEIQRSDIGKTFQLMGKTPDELNKGTAMYIKTQQQLGIQSGSINKNLSDGSAKYIMQLDLLSKLTGESAEALQAKQEEALAEEAYNQTIYELRQKELAGDKEAGRLRVEYEKTNAMLTGTALKEFQQGIGGDLSAMSKTMMTANGAVALIGTNAFSSAKYVNELGKGAERSRESYGGLMKFNATKDFLLPMKEISLAQSRYSDQSAQNQEEMAKAQQEAQKTGLDPNTKAMVNARIEQMNTRDALQSLVQKGVGPATSALEGFSSYLNKISGVVPGTNTKETDNKIGGGGGGSATVGAGGSVQIGDEVRSGGHRNWRNNNPGNIEYGKFAISMGAIGSDGRFAIFPTEEMGRAAADTLLKGKSYANLSAADAIKKWAPPSENDSASYINNVGKMANLDMTKKYVDMSKEEQGRFLDAMKKIEGGKVGKVAKADGSTPAVAPTEQKKTDTAVAPTEQKKTDTAVAPAQKTEPKPNSLRQRAQDVAVAKEAEQKKTTTAAAPAPVEKKETNPRKMYAAKDNKDPALAFEQARRETVEASQKQLDQLTKKSDIGPKKVTVTGNMSMGKPDGPIEYNGRTVKPEDSDYAEASKALVASMEKIDSATRRAREARASVARDSKNTMPQGEIVGTGDPAKISGADGFRGMLTGPSSGYKPDLTMHGTEQLTIKPTTSADTNPGSIATDQIMAQQLSKMDQLVQAFNNTGTQDMMAMQLSRLDDLVRVMQNQVNVSTKILQQSR
jgi:hypothetical protein